MTARFWKACDHCKEPIALAGGEYQTLHKSCIERNPIMIVEPAYEPPPLWPPDGWPPDFAPSEWNTVDHRGLLGTPGRVLALLELGTAEHVEHARRQAWNLQTLRSEGGTGPITILSGYRPQNYNDRLREINPGVAEFSRHRLGDATDITSWRRTPEQLYKIALELVAENRIDNGGFGLYPGFFHCDSRCAYGEKPARWDRR